MFKPRQISKFCAWMVVYLPALLIMLYCYCAFAIYTAPDDYLQGVYAKIMYLHVPSAWLAMAGYMVLGGGAIMFLASKNPIYDVIAQAAGRVGAVFCLVTLITGSLWGRPTWGVYWAWDARLTSMLLLQIIYLAYLLLRRMGGEQYRIAYVSSVFAVVGLINIPIIKFSVDLWSTLHQGASVIRVGGPSIHSSMLYPLVITALSLALTMLYAICKEVLVIAELKAKR